MLASLDLDDTLRPRAHAARAEIQAGRLRGAALLALIRSLPFLERDAWIDALLGIDPPPPDVPDLPHGAVPYLPCGVEEIVAMVVDVPLRADEHFVDLGSGLGRVVMLAHLLSGVRASGIELQAHLVRSAEVRASELALPVSFVHANAAETALEGSVFFLYAPFNGDMLVRVLRSLEDVARRRRIVLCAVGLELHWVPWLSSRRSSSVALAIYESR